MSADVKTILNLTVPVIVQIGSRKLPMGEILTLGPGAIIELPKSADEEPTPSEADYNETTPAANNSSLVHSTIYTSGQSKVSLNFTLEIQNDSNTTTPTTLVYTLPNNKGFRLMTETDLCKPNIFYNKAYKTGSTTVSSALWRIAGSHGAVLLSKSEVGQKRSAPSDYLKYPHFFIEHNRAVKEFITELFPSQVISFFCPKCI
ncbi:MAG: FliM/FliN family flagellar motor switch protein [Planctomycetota bacterium]